jgi:alanine racemase
MRIKQLAPGKKVFAMVKANAYGCGLSKVIPTLEGAVDAFGVASLEEALAVRALGARTPCVLFQGVFSPEELKFVAEKQFGCVIHQQKQLEWVLNTPLTHAISIWVKVNTGMNRLGFKPNELDSIKDALKTCPWVDPKIGLITHFACADQPELLENQQQMKEFHSLDQTGFYQCSMANSAGILAFPDAHADVVRPGIMLYGVSPFPGQTAPELGLMPVMRFVSAVSAVHRIAAGEQVGYGATWKSSKSSVIGIIPVGYGDGYPRHIAKNTPVWIESSEVPIIGRVSMDMMAVDLTDHETAEIGSPVELWGTRILVERIAQSAGTIGYELLCQVTERVRRD